MTIRILSRTIDYNGSVQVVQEDNFTWLEKYLKGRGSGESIEDAIERICIETKECSYDAPFTDSGMIKTTTVSIKKLNPSTLDHYLNC